MTRRDYIVVAVVSVLLALAFVDPYGTSNQATYALDPLHRAMPELFARDWFVHDTPPYLPVFGWLAAPLYRIDPDGAVAWIAAHVAVTLATYAALAWLVSAVARGWRPFALIAAFVAATTVRSMGGSYVLVGYLQPSALATLGWLCAMAAFVRGRYLACGIALALGGALHANFLVLGIGLFALAALANRASWRDIALVLAPQLAVLAVFLPQLVGAAGPSAEAVRILVEFHAPGHYAGARLAAWIPELVCWQLGAFAAIRALPESREVRALWRFSFVCSAIAIATASIVMIPALEPLTQVRWSRLAPFGQLGCEILIAAAIVARATRPHVLVFAAIALAVIVNGRGLHASWPVTLAIVAACCAVLATPLAATPVAVLAVLAALAGGPRGAGLTSTPAGSPSELALTSWIREHTETSALFVAPPQLGRFRLLARRAEIADSKSPPLRPDLLVAWYRRLCALVELDRARSLQDVEARYLQLSPEQFARVAHALAADYVIVPVATKLAGAPVYAKDEWAVYKL